MKYEQVYKFLMPKLESELPAYLTYHNSQHTKDVLEAVEHLSKAEHITGHEKELLLTAALFHDAGFIKKYTAHEEESCTMAREVLPAFNFNKEDIDTICGLIMTTKLNEKPNTLLQKIINDADLHYMGTSNYFIIANNLYNEYQHQGLVTDQRDWHNKQITFFQEHVYYTGSAIKKYGSLKKKNLELLSKRRPSEKHENKIPGKIGDWTLIGLGALAASYGLKGFLVPNGFFDGGVSGIALLLYEIYHLDLSLLIILLNLPIIVLSYFGTGKGFALKSIAGIIILGACLHFITFPVATSDKVLVAVFGGFFIGLGSGLAIRGGGVLDGSEILAMHTIKKTSFTISEIILAINVLIFSVAALKFGLEIALYSTLTYFAASQTIGYVIEGVEAYTGVTIISKESELIKRRLVNELGRGITVYKGERGFLPGHFEISEDCDIIFTVITRLELRKLKNLVQQSDSKAFVFANTIKEASGGIIKRKSAH
ncbi:MAG: YitT family protein [Ginsengibacter sp.]